MKRKVALSLTVITLLALLVRTIVLDKLPHGFHVDEVRVGLNAATLLETGKDQYGNMLPLTYNSFNENRPTGIFYSTVPSIQVLGKTIVATRLPIALYGAASIIALYFVAFYLTGSIRISLFSSIFLAFSSWHVLLSRATSEAVGSMFWFLTGTALFLLFLKVKTKRKKYIWLWCVSLMCLFISCFFYPSARVFVPLAAVSLLFDKRFQKNKKYILYVSALLFIFALGALSYLTGNNSRFAQVLLLNSPELQSSVDALTVNISGQMAFAQYVFNNPFILFIKTAVVNVLSYISPQFFLTNIFKPGRYVFNTASLLTTIEYVLLLFAVLLIHKKPYIKLLFLWVLIGIMPAALTYEDSPNMQRALFMVVGINILCAISLDYLVSKIKWRGVLICILTVYVFEVGIFFYRYLTLQPIYHPILRNEQSPALAQFINENYNQFSSIIVTNTPETLLPYILFFNKNNGKEVTPEYTWQDTQKEIFKYGKITYVAQTCPLTDIPIKPKETERILIVDTGDCKSVMNENVEKIQTFTYRNGSRAYNVYVKRGERN